MKKLLLTTVALVVLGAPALAADMAARPRYAKEPPPIAAPAPGKVSAIHFRIGDQVSEGADLIDVDDVNPSPA